MVDIPQDIMDEFEKEFKAMPSEIDGGSEFFFVGGATSASRLSSSQNSLASQLVGVHDISDLKSNGGHRKPIQVEDDLNDFVVDKVDIVDDSQYEDLFFAIKRKLYRRFDFIRILSEHAGDIPMTERDLVVSSGDRYLIDYLKNVTADYFSISQLAYLYALDTMGIDTVRFVETDGCPICTAHDSVLYSVRNVLNVLSSGEFLTHPYCDCKWEPVIYREMYEGPLTDNLDIPEIDLNGLKVIDVPVEMMDQVVEVLSGGVSGAKSVKFLNISDYILNEVDDVEDSAGVVVVLHGDTLVVHNSYVDRYGPVDFIKEFMKAKVMPDTADLDSLKGSQVYFIGGRSAYQHNGHYWDIDTGKCLT